MLHCSGRINTDFYCMFFYVGVIKALPIAEKHWDLGARRQPHSVTGSFFSALDDAVEKHREGLCGLDEVLLPIKLGTWRGGFVFIFVCMALEVNFVRCLCSLVRLFTGVGPGFHTFHTNDDVDGWLFTSWSRFCNMGWFSVTLRFTGSGKWRRTGLFKQHG